MRESVMLIEDDEDIRNSLKEILEDVGHTVIAAADGLIALELLQTGARPGVILLDLMMPVMNGWQFVSARSRQADTAHIPVLVITADAQIDQKAKSISADGYFRKPIDLDELLAALDRYCPPRDDHA
jgi:two-component system, chemotaxis family, chemotaxis protein CheY